MSVDEIVRRSNEARAQLIDRLKLGIVRIEAQKEVKETGSGMVISASPDRILVLTALHVVKQAKDVRVVFYSDRARPLPARKLPKHSEALDVAILEVTAGPNVRLPQDITPYHFVLASTLQLGAHIWTVNGDWIPVPNSITRLNHEADPQRFEYTNVSVGEGFSGGPVFDDYAEIVGMHDALNTEGNYAIGIKIDFALQTLEALDYNVPKAGPISLTAYGSGPPGQPNAPPGATRACEQGCEVKISELKTVQQYHEKRDVSGKVMEVSEIVYQLPAEWPPLRFLHRVTYIVTNVRLPSTKLSRQPDQFHLAATDRLGDTDCVLPFIAGLKMPCRVGNAYYSYKLYGPPGGDPVSIQVTPYP